MLSIFVEWWQAQPAVLPVMFQWLCETAILVACPTSHWNPQAVLGARPVTPVCVPPPNSTNNTINEFLFYFFECLQLFPGPDGPVMPRILDLVYGLCRRSISEGMQYSFLSCIVLLPFQTFKSADGLENEDRKAQSAKLQELTCQGTATQVSRQSKPRRQRWHM